MMERTLGADEGKDLRAKLAGGDDEDAEGTRTWGERSGGSDRSGFFQVQSHQSGLLLTKIPTCDYTWKNQVVGDKCQVVQQEVLMVRARSASGWTCFFPGLPHTALWQVFR